MYFKHPGCNPLSTIPALLFQEQSPRNWVTTSLRNLQQNYSKFFIKSNYNLRKLHSEKIYVCLPCVTLNTFITSLSECSCKGKLIAQPYLNIYWSERLYPLFCIPTVFNRYKVLRGLQREKGLTH